MSSFVKEFKKYQRLERWLTATIVLFSLLAPVTFSFLIERKFHWIFSALSAGLFIAAAAGIHLFRGQVAKKLIEKYQHLDVGYVLAKKLVSSNDPRRFVITNKGYNHYYLKCLNTGEQMLVSKHRIKEDFDIAN